MVFSSISATPFLFSFLELILNSARSCSMRSTSLFPTEQVHRLIGYGEYAEYRAVCF